MASSICSRGDSRSAALANPASPPATQLVDLLHKIAGSAAMMQDQDLSLPARAMEAALREGRGA
ncbi:MAG: hypothetical protein ACXWJJ_10415, partial [Ramlibacter sp.]